ncbi:Holliday junction branch migration protein RuvA [Virgibacillus dakarensis]|uniref:Holliday junction branch migration complex subunit RuvA n=1 Tax=Lentibacillus populi TaxID=1827502 RepID=A0A9W5TUC2_9BACI|nr:Holliday junction branch migration protein RuvA [Lentibacillus populi]MBT2215135.1 Holliday junction branch migration protein RuvA [Virgibacillus dakarensis]MTW84187.1 Holliday junction branch migration protein RuvA [Virgibacillus dakarensis]GGB28386.1 Holliday junction ATP-dependent DNA helicase RuvA [Lentibacillus populi]
MIAYIKGIVASIHEDSVIMDVQGVGYEIICANPFVFQTLLNKEAFVYTYHYVREDTQVLYGFKNQDEKSLFQKLLQVSGIGPKGALAILSSVNVGDFVAAVEREDDKFLTSFPGIGKKTARQVILDLKGKLTTMLSLEVQPTTLEVIEATGKGLTDAQEALKALGYSDREIRAIMPKLRNEDTENTDELIRKALGLLVKS